MGSDPCFAGFLVAAWNALEMIEHYDEVDIFQISHDLRKIDDRFIPDLVRSGIGRCFMNDNIVRDTIMIFRL